MHQCVEALMCTVPCRYQGVRSDAADLPGGAVRRQLPKLFASRLYERLSGLQRAGQLPAKVGTGGGAGQGVAQPRWG